MEAIIRAKNDLKTLSAWLFVELIFLIFLSRANLKETITQAIRFYSKLFLLFQLFLEKNCETDLSRKI